MAKLYFRHGTVGSAKTLNLLAVAHNYTQQGKRVVLMKPRLDTRFGQELIRSRAGLEKTADYLLDADSTIDFDAIRSAACVLVDEAQFLTPRLVDSLRAVTRTLDIPVICYGLRTDFRTRAFAGSLRLLELADAIEEIKTTCSFCEKKAIFNLKHINGVASTDGPTIDLGAEEKYLPACDDCYHRELTEAEASGERERPARALRERARRDAVNPQRQS